jgi:hypothetical protein
MIGVDNTITISYVDDDKVAAKSKKEAEAAVKQSAIAATIKSPVVSKPAEADHDPFGIGASAQQRDVIPVSVKDAFDAMCEIEPEAPASSGTLASSAATSEGKAITTASVVAPTSNNPILDMLSHEDMLVFLNSGGTVDTLSVIHVTPTNTDRDLLYYLLQLLRQLETRSHLPTFGFKPLTKLNFGDAEHVDLHLQSYVSWCTAGTLLPKPEVPLLLRPNFLAQLQAKRDRAGSKPESAYLDNVHDLFAAAPPLNQAVKARGESVVGDIYADLVDTVSADSF